MTRWFTADLHFGHANIINYPGRPFADATAMNQALVERWNAAIHPGDTVGVLGDLALGRIDKTLALVGELNGRKLLLAGNHDRCWAGHGRRSEGWTERYLAAGFAEVHQGQTHVTVGDGRVLRATSRIEVTATITTGSSSSGQSIKASGCSTATSTNGGASAAE